MIIKKCLGKIIINKLIGGIYMSNESIKCSVQQCKYNDVAQGHCSLNSIQVGTHELNPTKTECTDCMSFKVK